MLEGDIPSNPKEITPDTEEIEMTKKMAQKTAPKQQFFAPMHQSTTLEQQSSTSKPETGTFFQVENVEEKKSCHRLNVPQNCFKRNRGSLSQTMRIALANHEDRSRSRRGLLSTRITLDLHELSHKAYSP